MIFSKNNAFINYFKDNDIVGYDIFKYLSSEEGVFVKDLRFNNQVMIYK